MKKKLEPRIMAEFPPCARCGVCFVESFGSFVMMN
jgi:hypothetical protein